MFVFKCVREIWNTKDDNLRGSKKEIKNMHYFGF